MIPIVTSKELYFNADFKYTGYIKFSLTHKKLQAQENVPYFRKEGETPPKTSFFLMKVRSNIKT